MKLAAIIPTYNERENLPDLVEMLLALPHNLHVVVVDDNSPDGTGEIADQLAADDPRVNVVHRAGKLGLGTAYIAGMRRAFELEATHIMTMDADFSHHPRYIPAMIEKIADADLVIGSRYVPGGGSKNWPWYRVLFSWSANQTAKLIAGLDANDCTAGFRLYRREVLESINLDEIFSSGYSFLLEMLFKVQQRGWRVAESPIIFEDRTRGASKISQREVFKAMYTVLRLRRDALFGRTPSLPSS